jgi:hypothetical protein
LDEVKSRWLRVNFIDENFALISAFETYLVDKNEIGEHEFNDEDAEFAS